MGRRRAPRVILFHLKKHKSFYTVLNAETRVQPQGTAKMFCGEYSGSGGAFSPNLSVFPSVLFYQ
jgi:hypothetical protein